MYSIHTSCLFISIKLFQRKIKNGVALICMPLHPVGMLTIPETFRFNAKKHLFMIDVENAVLEKLLSNRRLERQVLG